jgi:hypothetical protein
MMKKAILNCVAMLISTYCLQAAGRSGQQAYPECFLPPEPCPVDELFITPEPFPQRCCKEKPRMYLEAKAANFFPSNRNIRKIYPGFIGIYGFEFTHRAWHSLYWWTGVSYLSNCGHSIGQRSPTKVTLVPFVFGLKYLHQFKYFDMYAGVGELVNYYHNRDSSRFVIHSSRKWNVGATVKVGFLVEIKKSFFADIFTDYSYMRFDFHGGQGKVIRQHVNFSGWSLGGAIGYRW